MKASDQKLIAVFFYDLFQQLKDVGVSLDHTKFQDFLSLFVFGAIDLDNPDKEALKGTLKDLLIALWVPKTKHLYDFERLFPKAFEAFYHYLFPDVEAEAPEKEELPEKEKTTPKATGSTGQAIPKGGDEPLVQKTH